MNTTAATARYRVVYCKTQPVTSKWFDAPEGAEKLAATLECRGYTTTVWEYTKDYARPYKTSLKDLFAAD